MTDYIKIYKELFIDHKDIEKIGEKDFYQFIKRANRDLSPQARYIIVRIAIEMITKGGRDE